ncbi:MAG: hypothetical protein OWV35_08595 [Firmicutes bacterium]|nr:hypothetical protein [Bacillota bacterium]
MNRTRWLVLDPGLLAALLEPDHPRHGELEELAADGRFRLAASAWSWAELMEASPARDWPRLLRESRVLTRAVDVAVLDEAAGLMRTYARPLREAVLVATALRLEAEAVVTGDPGLRAGWPQPPVGLRLSDPVDFLGPRQVRFL